MQRAYSCWMLVIICSACGVDHSQHTEPVLSQSISLKSYASNGFTLRYPDHWAFIFDDTPGPYSDRGLAFEISELSLVSVLIENGDTKLADVGNSFIQRLKLDTSTHVRDFEKQSVSIAGIDGIQLTWTDTMVDTYSAQASIFQVLEKPKRVFVVFNMEKNDVDREAPNMLPFLSSINFE